LPVGSWLGEIRIDGQIADLPAVRSLLRIHRIAGDETLTGTIARKIREDLTLVRRRRLAIESRGEALDHRLSEITDRLHQSGAADVERQHRELAERRARLREVRERLPGLKRTYDLLESARSARNTLQRLEADEPELSREIGQQTATEHEAAKAIAELEQQLAKLANEASEAAQLRSRLEDAERELARRVRTADVARIRAVKRASELGLVPDSNAVHDAHQEALDLVRAIRRRIRELDAAPRITALSASLEEALSSAAEAGLGETTIALLADDREITVAELVAGVARHRRRDSRRTVDELVTDLRVREEAADTRVSALWSLRQVFARAESTARSVQAQAKSIAAIRSQLRPDVARRYEELTGKIADQRARHLNAAVRRADLIGQLDRLSGGRSLADIRRNLLADLADAHVNEEELDAAWAAAQPAYEAPRAEAELLVAETAERAEALQAGIYTVQRMATRLPIDPATAWLSRTGLLPATTAPDIGMVAVLRRLESTIEGARDLLRACTAKVAALENPLEEMSAAVDRSQPEVSRAFPSEYRALYERLLDLYEMEFTERFKSREITEALFDSGTFQKLDLRTLSANWSTSDGMARSRPLEAFSSGERAFAYTLARLESIADEPTQNRVVALDEFGAFVARDRLGRLVRFLHKRILGSVAQQILIILPLTQDYASQVGNTTGPWGETVGRRADAIQKDGYFAEPFEVVP
jgi:hypothetical protein